MKREHWLRLSVTLLTLFVTGCASESVAHREQRQILKEMDEFAEHDEKERPIVKYY